MYRAPPECRKARAGGTGLGKDLGKLKSWKQRDSLPLRDVQAPIFTARPRGTRWAVAAISHEGESIKLGIFPHRRDALGAAAIMADACGGRWLP